MLNVKAMCAFVFLFGLNVFASDREALIKTSSQNKRMYGATEQEIALLRAFLEKNLNNPTYRASERAAIAKRAEERSRGSCDGYCCCCCWEMSKK